ncbi:MAG TPA: Hsp20/alpha crystallin family protein [Dissulfurispiraceae bacterium]|nr:Hsp20/alpha crystallin family protein [Dissulfurispiraceae bacterium]
MDNYDPSEDIFPLRERINKIFGSAHEKAKGELSAGWTPVVDIYETRGLFVVKADLPEVNEADISISVQGDHLRISGERRLQKDGRHYHQVERCCGRFSRSFVLPDAVDRDNIKAVLTDGILKVILSKKAKEPPVPVEIK